MAARSVLASKLSVLAAHSVEASVSLVWRHVASFGPRRPLRAAGTVESASQPGQWLEPAVIARDHREAPSQSVALTARACGS